jgi:hypothetical protein
VHTQLTEPSFSTLSTLPVIILPGQTKSLVIRFQSANAGQHSGTLVIFSNDPDDYPKNISVRAFGYYPNTMRVENTVSHTVDTIELNISVENYEDFVGFQFDLVHPAIMQYVPNSAKLTGRAQDHILMVSEINDTTLRAFAFSFQQKSFLGNSGSVLNFSYSVKATDGTTSIPLHLTNAIAGNSQSKDILWETQDGNILVQPLSVSEPGKQQFAIFPNPATEKLTLSFELKNTADVECWITDVAGNKVLMAFHKKTGPGIHSEIIDVKTLQPGIYLISVKGEKTSIKGKFCKL